METGAELLARVRALEPVAQAMAAAGSAGADVYLVGGAVRDLILGRPFVDMDLAVDGEAQQLVAALGAATSTETRFGTVTVTVDGLRFDIARTRSERYAHPGALPDVEPAGIDADLERRDFSVNALALGLSGARTGELIAAPGALDDLSTRELAVLHDASFSDDPTRLLRLARYAARLGFEVASRTRGLATEAIAAGALETVSGPRIGNELRLLAAEADPVAAFAAAGAIGLPWSIDAQLASRALDELPADGRRDLLVLACVLAASVRPQLARPQPHQPPLDQLQPDPPQLRGELDALGFTAADRDQIVEAATVAPLLAGRLASASSGSEIATAVGGTGPETVALAAALGPPQAPRRWLRELRHLQLEISGTDLISHGIPEGPAIGRALAAARAALMDGSAPDRDSQLKVALRSAG